MNVILTGSNGTIGKRTSVELAKKEIKVFGIDKNLFIDEELSDNYTNISSEPFHSQLKLIQPECVIHLAENIYADMQMKSHYITDNVLFTTELFSLCGSLCKNGTNIIVCTWQAWLKSFQSHTVLTNSLIWRNDLIEIFNIGNLAITNIKVGYLLDDTFPTSLFGSIISRLKYAIELDRPFVFFENEYPGFENESSNIISWNTIDDVVNSIISRLNIKSRTKIFPSNTFFCTIDEVIETYLYIHNIKYFYGYVNRFKYKIEFIAKKTKHKELYETMKRLYEKNNN